MARQYGMSGNWVYTYQLRDHLGSVRYTFKGDGTDVGFTHYYPLGMEYVDEGIRNMNSNERFTGHEFYTQHGLNVYDQLTRMLNQTEGRFWQIDRHAENYYDWSPYVYCGNNPVRITDPDGMDWFIDTSDNSLQFFDAPEKLPEKFLKRINNALFLWAGEEIVSEDGNTHYRTDGSILYKNETAAYKRMWSQANDHYKQQKEVGGFTLENGSVLVLPDYANEINETKYMEYGYNINGNTLTKGDETFTVTANIHTHQNPNGNPTPSVTDRGGGAGDAGFSMAMGGLPVITIGHDGLIHAVHGQRNPYGYSRINMNGLTRNSLLQGEVKLTPWLNTYPTRKK